MSMADSGTIELRILAASPAQGDSLLAAERRWTTAETMDARSRPGA
jgi:hypothetical protein